MNEFFPLFFMFVMGAAVLAYVVLDGYDLGVGMLMPAATEDEQSIMVASIGPFWDANETWLVLGIGVLLAAFPLAHGIVLGALYLPVVAMLVGIMFRGVAFELRTKAHGWHRELWNWLFWAGSFIASFFQGVMLGRYITGFESGLGYWLFAFVTGASLSLTKTSGAFNLTASGTLQLVGIAGVTIGGQFSVAYNSTGPVFTLTGSDLTVSAFGQSFTGNLTFTKNSDGSLGIVTEGSTQAVVIGHPGICRTRRFSFEMP